MRTMFGLESCLRLLILTLMPSFVGSGDAQQPRAPVTAALQSGTLSFFAHATVGDFAGATTTVSGMVRGSVSNPHGWVEAPVTTLVTHNDRRDRDMRASMEAPTYPTIRFELAGATVRPGEGHGDTVSVILHGTLTIHGVTRALDPPGTIVLNGDTILVVSSFPLDVRDYKVGGLTKMLGVLRMDPMIGVRVNLRFVANATPGRAGGTGVQDRVPRRVEIAR